MRETFFLPACQTPSVFVPLYPLKRPTLFCGQYIQDDTTNRRDYLKYFQISFVATDNSKHFQCLNITFRIRLMRRNVSAFQKDIMQRDIAPLILKAALQYTPNPILEKTNSQVLYRTKSGVLDSRGILELTCALYRRYFQRVTSNKKHVSVLRAPLCHGYFQTLISSQDTKLRTIPVSVIRTPLKEGHLALSL